MKMTLRKEKPVPTAASSAGQVLYGNRKEIPITSFDFLNGAYLATKRARQATFLVLGLVLMIGSWTVWGGFQARSSTTAVSEQVASLVAARQQLVSDFGQPVNGIEIESLLAREQKLSDSLALVTASQGDIMALLADLSSLTIAGVTVADVSYGKDAAGTRPGGPAATAGEASIPVKITLTSQSISATASAADQVRQLTVLTKVQVSRAGSTAVIYAQLKLNNPPTSVLDRLLALGIQPKDIVAPSATTTTVPGS